MNANQIQGMGLNVLSRFAQSNWPDRFGVRKPVERLLYSGSKAGFQLIGAARSPVQQGAVSG
jgi:hypothetical protein